MALVLPTVTSKLPRVRSFNSHHRLDNNLYDSIGSSKQRTKKITVACNFCRCKHLTSVVKSFMRPYSLQPANSSATADGRHVVNVSNAQTPAITCHKTVNGATPTVARRTKVIPRGAAKNAPLMKMIPPCHHLKLGLTLNRARVPMQISVPFSMAILNPLQGRPSHVRPCQPFPLPVASNLPSRWDQ